MLKLWKKNWTDVSFPLTEYDIHNEMTVLFTDG